MRTSCSGGSWARYSAASASRAAEREALRGDGAFWRERDEELEGRVDLDVGEGALCAGGDPLEGRRGPIVADPDGDVAAGRGGDLGRRLHGRRGHLTDDVLCYADLAQHVAFGGVPSLEGRRVTGEAGRCRLFARDGLVVRLVDVVGLRAHLAGGGEQ